ncbi:hypothetical protein EV424DRAFT_1541837 [Suillus variegatus]|nr:hypothetical protein EV424DRAFT_1541837 [Suillus variegatus]
MSTLGNCYSKSTANWKVPGAKHPNTAGNATSFSPLLLSCATVIRQYSKSGTFESVPNWTSKTVDYLPPFVLDVPLLVTSSAIPTTFPTSPPHIVPPLTTSALASTPSRVDPDIIAKPNPSRTDLDLVAKLVAQPKQSSRPRALKNPPRVSRPVHPPLRYCHLYVAESEREQWKVGFPAGDSKKRKADNEDTDGAVVIETPKLPSSSQELLNKKRKLMLDAPTGIIHAKPKALPAVAPDNVVPPGYDQGFRDSDMRPAEWGSDDSIATPLQHSVHFHPRKCDKCTKMDIPHCRNYNSARRKQCS